MTDIGNGNYFGELQVIWRVYNISTLLTLASQYPDACVVWVDAHADINTIESTKSGARNIFIA